MKILRVFTTAACFLAVGLAPMFAASAAQPTEASVKELLRLSHASHSVEMMKAQFTGMERGALQQALKGHEITPDVQKILEESSGKSSAIVNTALDWAKVEPVFVKVYQSTLTQKEVDGIVAFYKTPAGQAMVNKMPALMQQAGMGLRPELSAMMAKLRQLQQTTVLKLQAEFAKKS